MVVLCFFYPRTFNQNLMQSSDGINTSYLFLQDKHYDESYDTGDKTIQCERHVDILKLWLIRRAMGDIGFEKHIDRLLSLAKLLHDQVVLRENLEIVLENVIN